MKNAICDRCWLVKDVCYPKRSKQKLCYDCWGISGFMKDDYRKSDVEKITYELTCIVCKRTTPITYMLFFPFMSGGVCKSCRYEGVRGRRSEIIDR